MDRRTFLSAAGAAVGSAAALASDAARAEPRPPQKTAPWPLVLNTSTIMSASLDAKIDAARQAGYDGIELWSADLEKHEAEGGDLKEIGARIADAGLFVPNVIGLWDCMPPTEEAFQESLTVSRKRMRMAADVRAMHVAAIPLPDRQDFSLDWGARCYGELLRIGRDEFGILPAFEFVGFFEGIHRLGQATAIALDVNDADASLILDTFHLYRGGSGFECLQHLSGDFIAVFHWNDVPSEPPREEMRDEHRVLPGDGVLPLPRVLEILREIRYTGPLSLEIFQRDLWERDPLEVARLGLEKMRACIAASVDSA